MQRHSTARPDRAIFLEPSPSAADGGNLIGRDPRHVPVAQLKALGHPTSPIKAIRAKCLDCSGAQPSEVRKCVAHKCALWPLRMGRNPFYGHSEGDSPSEAIPQTEGLSLSGFSEERAIEALTDEERAALDGGAA